MNWGHWNEDDLFLNIKWNCDDALKNFENVNDSCKSMYEKEHVEFEKIELIYENDIKRAAVEAESAKKDAEKAKTVEEAEKAVRQIEELSQRFAAGKQQLKEKAHEIYILCFESFNKMAQESIDASKEIAGKIKDQENSELIRDLKQIDNDVKKLQDMIGSAKGSLDKADFYSGEIYRISCDYISYDVNRIAEIAVKEATEELGDDNKACKEALKQIKSNEKKGKEIYVRYPGALKACKLTKKVQAEVDGARKKKQKITSDEAARKAEEAAKEKTKTIEELQSCINEAKELKGPWSFSRRTARIDKKLEKVYQDFDKIKTLAGDPRAEINSFRTQANAIKDNVDRIKTQINGIKAVEKAEKGYKEVEKIVLAMDNALEAYGKNLEYYRIQNPEYAAKLRTVIGKLNDIYTDAYNAYNIARKASNGIDRSGRSSGQNIENAGKVEKSLEEIKALEEQFKKAAESFGLVYPPSTK